MVWLVDVAFIINEQNWLMVLHITSSSYLMTILVISLYQTRRF